MNETWARLSDMFSCKAGHAAFLSLLRLPFLFQLGSIEMVRTLAAASVLCGQVIGQTRRALRGRGLGKVGNPSHFGIDKTELLEYDHMHHAVEAAQRQPIAMAELTTSFHDERELAIQCVLDV